MIMAYANESKPHIALKLFVVLMPDEFKDSASRTTIIVGLARNLQIVDALQMFRAMPVEPSSESWSSMMISGLQQGGSACDALQLFKEMLAVGTEPTPHSFTSAITASSELPAHSTGLMIYPHVVKRGMMSNTRVSNAAISMFVKSGNLENARCLFCEMPDRDIVSWNSMILGYGQHGYGIQTIMAFHQMQKSGFQPDRISLLGLLHGCSHCGLFEEGKQYFSRMNEEYGVTPGVEHYACMVDLLARAGCTKEAVKMMEDMPFEPVGVFWRSILNGCRIAGDLELGLYAAKKVLELEPSNTAACLMAMKVCGDMGKGEEAAEMERLLKEIRGKEVGFSWIEVNGRIYVFTTRDETHPQSYLIYRMFKLLLYAVSEAGVS